VEGQVKKTRRRPHIGVAPFCDCGECEFGRENNRSTYFWTKAKSIGGGEAYPVYQIAFLFFSSLDTATYR
jgi:hypothetical protein